MVGTFNTNQNNLKVDKFNEWHLKLSVLPSCLRLVLSFKRVANSSLTK